MTMMTMIVHSMMISPSVEKNHHRVETESLISFVRPCATQNRRISPILLACAISLDVGPFLLSDNACCTQTHPSSCTQHFHSSNCQEWKT